MLIPFVLCFIDNFSPLRSFIASLLYLVAAAGDALDGYLARKPRRGQHAGEVPRSARRQADRHRGAGLHGRARARAGPGWSWCCSRAIFAVNGLRSVASAQGLVISASDGGKIKTALQLVAIMMLLIYFRYPVLGTAIAVDYHMVGLIVLYISMAVVAGLGAQYLRDFLGAVLRQPRAPA